jgi:mannitol-1-phosphate 5-dehydrogenase
LDAKVGIAEATILRSAIAPTAEQSAADPASVQSQDFWLLPLDGDALIGELPPVETLAPTPDFTNALERKLFTYNLGNATISFLGSLRGHKLLSEAANDPVIVALAQEAYGESGRALVAKFGFDPDDQREYAARSLAKFQDASIVDPIARQIADPVRKLGHDDRLVGAALNCLAYGVEPAAIAVAIAAALRYRDEVDPSAVRLAASVAQLGETGALASIGGLAEDHPLLAMVAAAGSRLDALVAAPSE